MAVYFDFYVNNWFFCVWFAQGKMAVNGWVLILTEWSKWFRNLDLMLLKYLSDILYDVWSVAQETLVNLFQLFSAIKICKADYDTTRWTGVLLYAYFSQTDHADTSHMDE